MDDVLGKLRPGRSKPNLEVDTPQEIRSTYEDLTRGAEKIDPGNYPADEAYLRGDGTRVYMREGSKSGGPTIDVFKPDGTHIKVHLPKGWKP